MLDIKVAHSPGVSDGYQRSDAPVSNYQIADTQYPAVFTLEVQIQQAEIRGAVCGVLQRLLQGCRQIDRRHMQASARYRQKE